MALAYRLFAVVLLVGVSHAAAQDAPVVDEPVAEQDEDEEEEVAGPTESTTRPLEWSGPEGDATAPTGYGYAPTSTRDAAPAPSAEGYTTPGSAAPPQTYATPPQPPQPPQPQTLPYQPSTYGGEAPSRAPRIGLELVGGVVGALLGTLIGYVIAERLCDGSCADEELSGAALGLVVGLPAGVWTAGITLDGNGGFGWTLLGSLVGWLVGGAIYAAVDDDDGSVLVAALAFPIGGAILGFEASSDASVAHTRITAGISPSDSGAVLRVRAAF